MKKAFLFLLLFAALGVGGYIVYKDYFHWEHRSTLELNGNVDIREVDLSFRVGGRLKSLSVDEGDEVQAGDRVACLDERPYEIALHEAEGNEASLKEKLSLMEAGSRSENIREALANWEAQKVLAGNAEIQCSRLEKLVDVKAVSRQDYDNSRAEKDRALSLARAYEEKYKALRDGYRPEEIAEAKALYRMACAQSEKARLNLSDTRLDSPSAGMVITRAIEPGSMVAAGAPVLTLSLTRPVRIRAYVDEPDLGRIHTGQKVVVQADSGERFEGTIGFISPKAEFTPKTVESRSLRTALVYRFRVTVDKPSKGLNQGMPVSVLVPL